MRDLEQEFRSIAADAYYTRLINLRAHKRFWTTASIPKRSTAGSGATWDISIATRSLLHSTPGFDLPICNSLVLSEDLGKPFADESGGDCPHALPPLNAGGATVSSGTAGQTASRASNLLP
jgi:hypothetical protein